MSDIKHNVMGFQHLGIPTADLEKSITFYCRLGFTVTERQEFLEMGAATKVAFLNFGDFCLELYQQASRPISNTILPGPIDHLTLDVRDIDMAFKDVSAAGFKPLEDAPISLPLRKNGIKYFIIHGPDGERVEFNQVV